MFRVEQRISENEDQEHSFVKFVLMEDLIEKLKLLNYENEFVKNLKMKPINRYYFVIPRNSGEQFYMFTCLAAWLSRKLGKIFEEPQEYDDPNGTIATILEVVRDIGAVVDFPPNKLKQGIGEHVVYILNQLADEALKKNNFIWKKPVPPSEIEPELQTIEDDSELILDKIEEEMAAVYSDDSSDENMFHVTDFNISSHNKAAVTHNEQDNVLSNIDVESWHLELERVLPQLKVTIKMDNRDWRSHLKQMKDHRAGIGDALTSTKTMLDNMHSDISNTLEKIESREKYINNNLTSLVDVYRILKDQVSNLDHNYKKLNSGVTERTRELAKITDQLESIKQQMEERGSTMTDGTPLINIKKAVTTIKNEINEMDIRIGVLQSLLMQAKIRNKNILQENLQAPENNELSLLIS